MEECPAMADPAKYRTAYYEFVFNGKVVEADDKPAGKPAGVKQTPAQARAALAAQVAADRNDPRKAAMRAESLARREAAELERAALASADNG